MNRYLTGMILVASCAVGMSTAHGQAVQPHNMPADMTPQKAWDSITETPCPTGVSQPSVHCSNTVAPAFDANGRLWLAWVNDGRVYVSHSDDRGKTLSTPSPVHNTSQAVDHNGENRPKIIPAADGTLYVTYTIKAEKKFTGDVLFSRSTDGGKSFSSPRSLNDATGATSLRFENLMVNDDGVLFVTWLDKRDLFAAKAAKRPYTGSAIYYTYSLDRGATFAPTQKIADSTCECCRIAVDTTRSGLPVILWRHVFGNGSRDHAVSAFKAINTPGPIVRVSSDEWPVEACPHHGPALSIDAAGVQHVTWFTMGEAREGAFYARSIDGGKTFIDIRPIGSNDHQAEHPFTLAHGTKTYVAWKEFDGENSVFKLMTSSDQGVNWSEPKTLLQATDTSDHPLLVADASGVYASWWGAAEGWRLVTVEIQ